MRPGFQNAVEAEKELGLPVLGLIPTVHRAGRAKDERWEILEAYGLTEAIRSLVYTVVPKTDREGRMSARILAITSSFPDEGKSTVALSLARQAAFSGLRTLLIEGDLRKPGMREGMTKIKTEVGPGRYPEGATFTMPTTPSPPSPRAASTYCSASAPRTTRSR